MPKQVKPLIPFKHTSETLAGLIYGVVTSMAVIAALADADEKLWYISLAAFLTSFALVLTFVFSHWLAGSFSEHYGHDGVRTAWNFELPTLVGPIFLGLVMVVEQVVGVGTVVAAEAAMWVGVFFLFVLGYRIALMSGRGHAMAFGLGLLDAGLGAVIVLVKVLAH